MTPTPQEQATFLGNGHGMVYITGPSGTFPTPFTSEGSFPQTGFPNGLAGKSAALSAGKYAKRSAFGTKATWRLEITAAAADNLTVLKVGGVSQILGPVAMTAGNVEASASSIAAAINAGTPTPGWLATSRLGVVYAEFENTGTSANGLAINVTFSGATTYDASAETGGGTDGNAYAVRIFLDTADSASPSVMGPGAIEITQAIAAMPNTPLLTATLGGTNTIVAQRTESYADIKVSGGTMNTFQYLDVQDGDVVVLRGNTAAGLPLTVTNAGNVVTVTGNDVVLTDDEDSILLTYINGSWLETGYRSLGLSDMRSLSGNIPAYPGVTQATIPAAGNYIIAPGGTGGGYNSNKCYVEFTGANQVLAGPVNIVLTRGLPAQDLKDGDFGAIFFSQTATTGGVNVITINDTDGIVTQVIDDDIAATGNYAVMWAFDGTRFMASVIPNVTATGWIKTAMIGALQVTDAKIADVDGAKVQTGTLPFSAADPAFQALVLGGQLYTATLTIATADVLTLTATPIEIIPNPGPGFKVKVLQASCKVVYNTAAYVVGNLYIKTFGATQPQWNCPTILQATLTREELFINQPAMGAADTQIIANAAVQVTAAANPTVGDSDIIVTCVYMILPD